MARKKRKAGSTFTKTLTRGPNKGDTVAFKVASGGKVFPTRIVSDTGSKNTSKVAKQKKKRRSKKK